MDLYKNYSIDSIVKASSIPVFLNLTHISTVYKYGAYLSPPRPRDSFFYFVYCFV